MCNSLMSAKNPGQRKGHGGVACLLKMELEKYGMSIIKKVMNVYAICVAWGKGLFVVNTLCQRIALRHKSGFVSIDSVFGVVLDFEYPPTSNFLLVV